MNTREKEIKLGWMIVSGILGFVLLLSLLSVLMPLLIGLPPTISSFVRFGLTLGLCWMVYQGRGWARFVLVALLLLTALTSFLGGGRRRSAVHHLDYSWRVVSAGRPWPFCHSSGQPLFRVRRATVTAAPARYHLGRESARAFPLYALCRRRPVPIPRPERPRSAA